jgi:hypothetical protein
VTLYEGDFLVLYTSHIRLAFFLFSELGSLHRSFYHLLQTYLKVEVL